MKVFAVLICDIAKSRTMRDRSDIQKSIELGFETVNQKYASDLAVPFQFSLGDEFQCVLNDRSKAPRILARLREYVAPVAIRAAIGIGEITTELSHDIRRVDGPAFHAARDAILELKKAHKNGLKRRSRLTALRGEQGTDEVVDTVYSLYDIIINERTYKQWSAAKVYNITKSVAETARVLGQSPSSVSQHLSAARLYETNHAEDFLSRYLKGEPGFTVDYFSNSRYTN